jgi:hypothetical protein
MVSGEIRREIVCSVVFFFWFLYFERLFMRVVSLHPKFRFSAESIETLQCATLKIDE